MLKKKKIIPTVIATLFSDNLGKKFGPTKIDKEIFYSSNEHKNRRRLLIFRVKKFGIL